MSEGNDKPFIAHLQSKEGKEQAMKCPLSKSIIRVGDEASIGTMVECLKEECAWWVETQGRCAIKDVALSLDYISTDLTHILESMPIATQSEK